MFRVPIDPHTPTFDSTFKVSFGRWMTSSARDRREWIRRRNAATQLAAVNQRQRIADRVQRWEESRGPAQPVNVPPAVDQTARSRSRPARAERWLETIHTWATGIELAGYLVAIALMLAACGGIAGFLLAT